MSSTNKTTNYELSQYIGTDKPTYLGDYNSDMLKIDTRMKANQTANETNATAIETVSTTATSALEKATANETAIGNVSTTATQALTKANANETAIIGLEAFTNIVASETKIGKLGNDDLYRIVITYNMVNAVADTGWHQFDIPFTCDHYLKRIYTVNASYDYNGNGAYNAVLPHLNTNGGLVAIDSVAFVSNATGGYVRMRTYNHGIPATAEFEIVLEYTITE